MTENGFASSDLDSVEFHSARGYPNVAKFGAGSSQLVLPDLNTNPGGVEVPPRSCPIVDALQTSLLATMHCHNLCRRLTTSFIALVALSAAATVSGQDWARKMFEEPSFKFGTVARGAKAEHRFVFKNLYEEDVHVASVRSSCGCTTPTVSKDTLKTFEKGEIIATFNTRSFLGSKSATVTVTFDKPFYAEVQLQVEGYIRSDVVFHPPAVEIGTIEHGTPVEKTISIDYAGRNDWKILKVETPGDFVQTKLVEKNRGNGQVSYDLHVHLTPEAPVGYIHDQIRLVTNDQRSDSVPLDIEGRINSEITVSPSSLFLGTVQPGDKVTKQLVVRASKPFHVLSVECDDPSFTFKAGDESKALHLIPVTFTAGEQPGKISRTIRITTDLGETTTTELIAHAQVGGEGKVEPSTESVSVQAR